MATIFTVKTAMQTPEFQAFLDAVKTFVGTKGAGVSSIAQNGREVSCVYTEFLEKYEVSADTKACLTLLRRHRALQLEELGITWAGSRIAALIEKFEAHQVPPNKGNRRVEGDYKDPYYAKKKFEKTDVYETLTKIEEAFTEEGVAERQWSLAERDLYLKLLVKRVDKLREIKLPQDKVKVQIIANIAAFLRDLGATGTKGGTKRRDRARTKRRGRCSIDIRHVGARCVLVTVTISA